MGAKIALCIEEEACRNPRLLGLEGEVLDVQPWLSLYTTGEEARAEIAMRDDVEELWVVDCEDIEPINLAASIKSDNPTMTVRLLTAEPCGSLLSRAHTAHIDEVMGQEAFLRHYVQAKHKANESCDETVPGRLHSEFDDGMKAGGGSACNRYEQPVSSAGLQNDVLEQKGLVSNEGLMAAAVLAPPIVTSVLEDASVEVGHSPVMQEQPVTIERFLDSRPVCPTATDGRAFVLTVVSGSGGAGKSTVSALGALIASKWGYKTLLLDCDLQFGDVASMVGVENPTCIDEMLARPERFENDVQQGSGLVVLAAPSRLEASEEVVHQLPWLVERMAMLFEVVVINTGATWAEQHAVLLERSSVSLFLVDQRVSSVRACRHALELCGRCGIAASPFQYALNRCSKGSPLSTLDVSSALQGAPVFELKDGGRDVEDYLSGGAAAELIEVRNEFAKSLERVMERLLPGGSRRSADQMKAPEDNKKPSRRRLRPSGKWGRRRQ